MHKVQHLPPRCFPDTGAQHEPMQGSALKTHPASFYATIFFVDPCLPIKQMYTLMKSTGNGSSVLRDMMNDIGNGGPGAMAATSPAAMMSSSATSMLSRLVQNGGWVSAMADPSMTSSLFSPNPPLRTLEDLQANLLVAFANYVML